MDWWTDADQSGTARVVHEDMDDSGLLYFFEPGDNWGVLIKVLDGCHFNDRHWVFAASATDVGLDLTVRDTVTGEVRHYTKDPGVATQALADVGAFPDACRQ